MRNFLFAAAVLVCCATTTQATLIAGWNFNDQDLAVDHGAGALTTTFPAASQNLTFTGTTLNAVSGDPAGNDLALVGNANNGQNITFAFSTAALQDLVMSLAARRSGTGFASNQVAYSSDGGGSFTDLGSPYNPNSSAYEVLTFDFSSISALNNNPNVQIRITLDGATGSAGNHRFDNIQFNAVPEPATLTLLLLGGLALSRRRR